MVILLSVYLTAFLYNHGWVDRETEMEWGEQLIELAFVKLVIWAVISLALFVLDMIPNCGSGILMYGVVLLVVHFSLIIAYLFCNKRMIIRYLYVEEED